LFGINLTVVGYKSSPLNLTVSNFFGTIITSPSFNNKSDFEPGELTIDIKSIPIASDFDMGISPSTEFFFKISLIRSDLA
jgi:hypothetical protein